MKVNKIFIINLERDTKRKQNILKQLEQNNIQNYEFIRAIDGQNGDLEYYSFDVIPDWIEPFTSKVMTKGEIGCALSHYNIWEKIINENIEYTLILEDDIILCDNFSQKLDNICSNILETENMDLLYLGRRPLNTNNETKINCNIIKVKYSYGTHAYIVTNRCAQKLLNCNYLQNLFPVDEFLSLLYDDTYPYNKFFKYFENKSIFNAYSVTPLLVDIEFDENYKSTTYSSDPYLSNNKKTNILLLTVCTYYNDQLKRFEKSCEIYGHYYKILGLNTDLENSNINKKITEGQKINILKKELLTWKIEELNQLIIFTDSYNVIINANTTEIIKKYNNITNNDDNVILFSSNSCSFIGKAKHILNLLDKEISDSDQYYNMKFLSSFNETNCIKIILDYNCEIFQILNGSIDNIEVKYCKSRIINKLFNTSPCIIDGNGSKKIKLFLNSICNYLCDGWNSCYKYCINNEIKNTPKIYISYNGNKSINSIINYPEEKYIVKNVNYFNVVEDFLKTDAEYLFMIEKNYYISNPNTLKELLNIDKSITGPMILKKDNIYWSNFWGDLDNNGFYKRSFDYLNIINYERKAIWNVPYLTGIYLIKREIIEQNPNIYYENNDLDIDMRFCKNIRDKNIFMYISNMDNYGYIDDDEFTIYDIDHIKWEEKYIHHEYIKNKNNLFSICNEPCKDVYLFPIFTKLFCEEIINYCNDLNKWSDCKNNIIDPRLGNYENVPTQDIHLKQINFDKQWEKIVFKYIVPMASIMYSFYKTKNINISFVVKYSMDGQKELVQHHDASTYTVNICLNNEFEGGGCYFVRQNFILNNKKIGYTSMHPGRLTHCHEGLEITNGKRFILVSFIN